MKSGRQFPLLTSPEQAKLQTALHYLKMAELRQACLLLNLPSTGKKGLLIQRIMAYIRTGEVLLAPLIPPAAQAKNYPSQPLAPTSLMLYGAYKNDLKTRQFFQKLIGPRFHFTAFGIDWLNERWLAGQPPTYQAFAQYWVAEMARRSQVKAQPKAEWQYISFLQRMQQEQPALGKTALMGRWRELQAEQAAQAFTLLAKLYF